MVTINKIFTFDIEHTHEFCIRKYQHNYGHTYILHESVQGKNT